MQYLKLLDISKSNQSDSCDWSQRICVKDTLYKFCRRLSAAIVLVIT